VNTQGWRVLSRSLLAFWVGCALLDMTGAGPFFLRSYGADVTVPAWMYIMLRSLEGPRRRQVFHRLLGRTPEQAAVLLFLASTATELMQRFFPRGPIPGTFDKFDIVAFAVGLVVVYVLDKRSAEYRRRQRPPPIGLP
jgi:hypothetical protein